MKWTLQPLGILLAGLLPILVLGCSNAADDEVADDNGADDDIAADDDTEAATTACGAGDWGFITDPDNSIHVRVGGSDEHGDGSAANPLATLGAALVLSRDRSDNKRIAVGPGEFPTNLNIVDNTVDSNDGQATDSGLSIEG